MPAQLLDIRYNIRLLKIFGLLGLEGACRWKRTLHLVYSGLVVSAYVLMVVPASAALVGDWGDLGSVVDNACLVLPLFFSGVRCVYFMCRRRRIGGLIAALLRFEDYHCPRTTIAERASIMAEVSRISGATTIFFNFLGIFMLLTTSVSPVIAAAGCQDAIWRHPIKATYFFLDHLQSPCYEAVYVFQVTCLCLINFNIITFDTACMVLMMHGGAQFDVLSASLKHVREMAEGQLKPVNNAVSDEELADADLLLKMEHSQEYLHYRDMLNSQMRCNILHCIKHHKDIIEFIKQLDDVYNPVMLVLIVYSMTMIAITSFQATESSAEVGDFLKFAALSSTCIFELYLFCRLSHDIIQQSQAVASVAYGCDWYDGDAEFKSTLKMLIMRANKPVTLSAGRFQIMSLETFAALLNSSYSFFAMLKQLKHQDIGALKKK